MTSIGRLSDGDAGDLDTIRNDLNGQAQELQRMATETGVRDLVLAATQATGAALVLATVLSQRKEEMMGNGKADPTGPPPLPFLALDKRPPERDS